MRMRIVYESDACPRCAGTGRYSFNEVTGSVCFRCNGSGRQLTRAGAGARRRVEAMLDELWNVRLDQVHVGDFVWTTAGHYLSPHWLKVEKIEQSGSFQSHTVDGVEVRRYYTDLTFIIKGKEYSFGAMPEMIIRRWKPMPEDMLARIGNIKGVTIVSEEKKE